MKNNKILMSRIILAVLLITLLLVFTGCSSSDVLGISVVGLLISIGALLSSVVQAIVSALGLAVSGVASIIMLFVKLIEFIVSLF